MPSRDGCEGMTCNIKYDEFRPMLCRLGVHRWVITERESSVTKDGCHAGCSNPRERTCRRCGRVDMMNLGTIDGPYWGWARETMWCQVCNRRLIT